jgi:pimeloyl-ACP methyl ester carboxylesterase
VSIDAREHVLVAATAADLPPRVAAALAAPTPGDVGAVNAAGIEWATLTWGQSADPPLLLVHGVTSESAIFWRIAPALAASGRRVVAVDLPGHGSTGQWQGRHRFAETAADLAAFIRAAGLEQPDLAVLGHSWGGMVVAALPAAGLRPATLILLDPPHQTRNEMHAMTLDPTEAFYDSFEEARSEVRAAYPTWSDGDVEAKARGLTRFDVDGVLAVLLENGTWDAGLAALDDPAAADAPVWYVRGEFHAGGLIPETAVPELAARAGADHVLTIAGGPHSPMRTHPEATVLAILRALEG